MSFNIGDRVKVVRDDIEDSSVVFGKIGTVRQVVIERGLLGIEFDSAFPEGHTLNGNPVSDGTEWYVSPLVPDGTGWYVSPEALVKL